MALSSLKDRQYSYSSKWNNPDTLILVREPELDALSLQSMEGHLQTIMEVWVDNRCIYCFKLIQTVLLSYANIKLIQTEKGLDSFALC